MIVLENNLRSGSIDEVKEYDDKGRFSWWKAIGITIAAVGVGAVGVAALGVALGSGVTLSLGAGALSLSCTISNRNGS